MGGPTCRLDPAPPFDFALTLAFAERFPTSDGVRVGGRGLTTTFALDRRAILCTVSSEGTIDAPALRCRLDADGPLGSGDRERLCRMVGRFLSVDDDLGSFYARAAGDPAFAPIVEGLYGYHQVRFRTPFEAAAWGILSQRNRWPIARRMKEALVEGLGPTIERGGRRYAAFPGPDAVVGTSAEVLVPLVRNHRRVEYLLAAAWAFASVDGEWLYTAPVGEVRDWLLGIRGIGPWTASLVLIRGLGRMEWTPSGADLTGGEAGVLYGDGREASAGELEAHAARYGPYRGYWAHYLRAAAMMG